MQTDAPTAHTPPHYYSLQPFTKSICELTTAQSLRLSFRTPRGISYISAIHHPAGVPDHQPMGTEWIPPIIAADWRSKQQEIIWAQWQKMTRWRWSLRVGGLEAGSAAAATGTVALPLLLPQLRFLTTRLQFSAGPPALKKRGKLLPGSITSLLAIRWESERVVGEEKRRRERVSLGEEQVDWVTALVNTGKCQAPHLTVLLCVLPRL